MNNDDGDMQELKGDAKYKIKVINIQNHESMAKLDLSQ